MAEYLATARTPEGKKVTERVDVGSADEAVALLRSRGYDEIVLHSDDVGARYTQQRKVEHAVSPAQYLWFRKMRPGVASFLILTIGAYRRGWIWNLAALGILVYRRTLTPVWDGFDFALVVYLVFPLVFAAIVPFFMGGAGRNYRLPNEAASWGRWEEALTRVETVRGKVAPEEYAFQKAKALAGLGRLDEALEVVAPLSDGQAIPSWMYWSRLSSVYWTAKRRDDFDAAMDRALESGPDNATVLIDAADGEVSIRHNPRRARELLARARAHAISDVLQPFTLKIEGLIRIEEGKFGEARDFLEQALRKLSAFQHASPLVGVSLDKIHAALAIAYAGEGDLELAKKHYQLARPRLVALQLDEQLTRCRKALNLSADE